MTSPEFLPTIPPEGSRHRRPYERAARHDNLLQQAGLSIDYAIDALQRAISMQQAVDITHEITQMQLTAHQALTQANTKGEGSWVDYFRLVSQNRFLEQRIAVPLVFRGGAEKYTVMHHFVDGIYGMSGEILSQALDEYYTATSSVARSELVGVIHEQTTLALLNRREHPRHFALPASTTDDLYRRTDIDYWQYAHQTTRADQAELIPIQVKSYAPYGLTRTMAPKKPNGIVIDARDLRNHHNFRAARLIVRELGYPLYEKNSDPLSKDEQQLLTGIHANFMAIVQQKYHAVVSLHSSTTDVYDTHQSSYEKNPFLGILPLIQRTNQSLL